MLVLRQKEFNLAKYADSLKERGKTDGVARETWNKLAYNTETPLRNKIEDASSIINDYKTGKLNALHPDNKLANIKQGLQSKLESGQITQTEFNKKMKFVGKAHKNSKKVYEKFLKRKHL